MRRRIFFSFYYKVDNWRAAQVRSMGTVEGNEPVSDNDWEEVTGGGDLAIKKWIAEQQHRRSCTVVLISSNTAGRKWINHEIITSWDKGMGVVGIRIHGLKNQDRRISRRGRNPFEGITVGRHRDKLSSIVTCYNPSGGNSNTRYAQIGACLSGLVEDAINTRKRWAFENLME